MLDLLREVRTSWGLAVTRPRWPWPFKLSPVEREGGCLTPLAIGVAAGALVILVLWILAARTMQ